MVVQNNYWEEQNMSNNVSDFHKILMAEMNLPDWIKEIRCPFCNRDLSLISIRNIQLCLNTRNFGDIAIEVLCNDCNKMDTLYFRKGAENISDFINHLMFWDNNDNNPKPDPIIEEEMYKMQYNNVVEEMVNRQIKNGVN